MIADWITIFGGINSPLDQNFIPFSLRADFTIIKYILSVELNTEVNLTLSSSGSASSCTVSFIGSIFLPLISDKYLQSQNSVNFSGYCSIFSWM